MICLPDGLSGREVLSYRTYLRHETLLVLRGFKFIEPLHLGGVGHLEDERLSVRAIDDEDGRTRGWICEVRFVQES